VKALLSVSLFYLLIILLTAYIVIDWPANAQQKALASTSSNSRSSILQNNITQQIITRNNIEAKLLAKYLQNTLNSSGSILEILSSHPDIRSLQFVNSINSDFHGYRKMLI
jgi:hypothetical protein